MLIIIYKASARFSSAVVLGLPRVFLSRELAMDVKSPLMFPAAVNVRQTIKIFTGNLQSGGESRIIQY